MIRQHTNKKPVLQFTFKCILRVYFFENVVLITNFLFTVKYIKNNNVLVIQSTFPAVGYYSTPRKTKIVNNQKSTDDREKIIAFSKSAAKDTSKSIKKIQ